MATCLDGRARRGPHSLMRQLNGRRARLAIACWPNTWRRIPQTRITKVTPLGQKPRYWRRQRSCLSLKAKEDSSVRFVCVRLYLHSQALVVF